jgi:hypoxanthine-guanine phosphoribosyltransferase
MAWAGLLADPRGDTVRASLHETLGRTLPDETHLPSPMPWPMPSVVQRKTIDAAIARMADEIARDYAGEVPVYLTIMHGALPFAGQLSLEIGARGVDLPSITCTPPATAVKPSAANWCGSTVRPPPCSAAALLVDDILDEGFTLQGVRQWCIEQGPPCASPR